MNRLNQLTIKSLKMNKKRTLATIFGIILSTALICALSGLVMSIQKTLIEGAKKNYGNYHAGFQNVLKENIKYIEENRKVKDFYCIEGLGYSFLSESKNPDKPYFYLMAFDEKALLESGIELIEGRMPENEKEVVITKSIHTNAGVLYSIGDVLSLSVSKRESEGFELLQNTPYINNNLEEETKEEKSEEEILVEKWKEDYTIVGIIERPNYTIEPYTAPGYSVITKMDTVKETADIYVNFKKAAKAQSYALEIKDVLNKYQDLKKDPEYNRELLRWYGNFGDGTKTVLYSVGTIVMFIIIISSIFVIRNSFAISVMERRRQYGMLASIGATSKQIHRNVLFEAFLLGFIAIPFGILSGIFAVFILLWIVNKILMSVSNTNMLLLYSLPVVPVLISMILSLVTIYFSAVSSAKKASRVTPLEAIRNQQDIKITAKKMKTPKGIKKYFGIGGEIAYKNLKRSRSKYRTTVISLVVSIVLFLSVYAMIEYGFRYSNSYYTRVDYNLLVRTFDNNIMETEELYRFYQELSQIEGIKEYNIIRSNDEYKMKHYLLSELGEKIIKNKMEPKEESFYCNIISFEKEVYEDYKKSLGIHSINKNEVILIENGYHYIQEEEKYEKLFGNFYDFKEGDEITLVSESGKEISLSIRKITTERPMGFQNHYNDLGFLVLSDDLIEEIGYNLSTGMTIQAEDPDNVEEKLQKRMEELLGDNRDLIVISNLAQSAREENAIVLIIEIFMYGFITVITFIGVTNIFNTITTNMTLREKEFAMLRSIGMTQKEFSGMIRLESIFYGLKALFIGIPLGTICSYLIYRVVYNSMEMNFILPWRMYLISIIFVLLIVGLTMRYSFLKIRDQNIMETIRKDTI